MLRVKPLATRDMDPAVRSWGKLAEVYGYVPEVLAGMTWYQGLKDGRSGRVCDRTWISSATSPSGKCRYRTVTLALTFKGLLNLV